MRPNEGLGPEKPVPLVSKGGEETGSAQRKDALSYQRGERGINPSNSEIDKRLSVSRLTLAAALIMGVLLLAKAAVAESIIQDFRVKSEFSAYWDISTWGDSAHQYAASNVYLDTVNGWVRLKLDASPAGTRPVGGEISSRRSDFRYGSYRASLKFDNTPGAVVGWFVYKDVPDLNEIDVEFLTEDISHIHYTLHHIQTNVDYRKDALDFDPTAAFHEYRFDWYPDRVVYYIDGMKKVSLQVGVPDSAGAIMLNFWSANIDGWGGPAPAKDAYMYVDYVRYYSDYNAVSIIPADRGKRRDGFGATRGNGPRYRCNGELVGLNERRPFNPGLLLRFR
ncbi:MAG: glycoside hydrolase family 16 protein [Fibrobacteria bacterium]